MLEQEGTVAMEAGEEVEQEGAEAKHEEDIPKVFL